MPDWTIRPALAADEPALRSCIDAAYLVHKARIHDLPDVSAGIADDIRDDLVFVAERNGSVVGGMILKLRSGCFLLANLAVAPQAAGIGLGRALLARAEAEARQAGVSRMLLTTHVEMPQNVGMYQHLGWLKTGQSGNKVHMAKDLGPPGDRR